MRPRKRDFRGDTRKGAKNYDIVSSDDSEVYRRKDPFAGRNRKRPSGRRAQKIVSCRVVKHLLHIGEKRREELIGGLPAQGGASGSCCTHSCISLIACCSLPSCRTFSLHRTFRCPCGGFVLLFRCVSAYTAVFACV